MRLFNFKDCLKLYFNLLFKEFLKQSLVLNDLIIKIIRMIVSIFFMILVPLVLILFIHQ